jgi:MFS family permease
MSLDGESESSNMTTVTKEKPGYLFGRLFYGWVIVLAVWFIMFFCAAAQIGSFPVFFGELLDYFDWSRGSLSLGFTLNMVLMAIFGLLAGVMTNRIGPKRTVLVGAVVGGASIALVSLISQPWHFYTTYGCLLPFGISMAYVIPTITTVRRWFSRKAALAVSLAFTGSGVGLAAGPPLAQFFIDSFGWQVAYRLFALMLAVGVIACALLLKRDPESVGAHPDGIPLDNSAMERRVDLAARSEVWPIRKALRTRTIWLFMAAQAGFMVVVMSMLGHIKVWVDNDLGYGAGFAVAMTSLFTSMAVLGRLCGGFVSDKLMDRFGRKPILYFCVIGVTVSAFYALAVNDWLTVAIFAVLLGFTYGTGVGVFPTYLGDLYGVANMPVLLAVVGAESASVGGLGPWFFGAIHDRMGSYDLAFVIGGGLCILSLICLFLIKAPIKRNADVSLQH